MSTPKQDIEKAEAFFKKYSLFPINPDARRRAIAELAHEFFVERTHGRTESVLEMRVTMGEIAQKAMAHVSDECLELLVNHNGRNMVLKLDAPKRRKKG